MHIFAKDADAIGQGFLHDSTAIGYRGRIVGPAIVLGADDEPVSFAQ